MFPFRKIFYSQIAPLYSRYLYTYPLIQCLKMYIKNKSFQELHKIDIFRFKSSVKLPANSLPKVTSSGGEHFHVSHHSLSAKQQKIANYENNFSNTSQNEFDEKLFYQSLLHTLEKGVILDDLDSEHLALVTEKFGLKGLNIDYIYEHGVKISSDFSSLIFPFDSLNKEFAAIQSATFKNDTREIVVHNTFSKCPSNILFGWSLVGLGQKEIIIVSDPLDAIAVNQETDLPTVSVSSNFTEFSNELINVLKNFLKITFWLKSELHAPETHNLLGQSLGKKAFFISSQDYPHALKCLRSGIKIKEVLKNADPIYHEGVDTIEEYRDVLYERFQNHESYSGFKWERFSALNEILKGHRKRELTVFSGQTGTGKTTFMSEYSLDLCIQGLPTLWASFEISNERLLEIMICQYAQCSLVENVNKFHYWFDQFKKLPMYILNMHGRKSLPGMLQAMKTYVRAYNVQHIVVDNLQFLMNIENYGSLLDQYRRQDEIYGAFRGFATRCNCHISLVIHPRKEPEFAELNNASISGTAKATQEADNILILQTTKTRQYLHITKNRYAGVKGCVIVEFDKKSQTFKQKKISSTLDGQDQKKVL